MRQKKIEHLGQVKMALLETDGCLSVIPYSKENIKWGLPLFPDEYQIANHHNVDHFYSCMLCGQTQLLNHLKKNALAVKIQNGLNPVCIARNIKINKLLF